MEERKRQYQTRRTMSNKIGYGKEHIANVELGWIRPSLDFMKSYSTALGYDLCLTLNHNGGE